MSQTKTVLIIIALAGCGSVDTAGPDADPSAPDADPSAPDADPSAPDADLGGDHTAPTVTSFAPADGTAGVAADAVIIVVFSEPMNTASVESAWRSSDLPAAAVGFGWSSAGDTLTVTPDAPLTYAEGVGTDPSVVVAHEYTVGFDATATDLAGNPLGGTAAITFTTRRRLGVDLAPITALTRSMRGDGLVFGETAVTMTTGDSSGNLQYKTFVAFTLPQLPAGAALETAELSGNQTSIVASPYLLGPLGVRHVNTATLDAAAFAAAPLSVVGTLSADATTGVKSVDVATQLADDLANHAARGERSQYRLEFSTSTNSDASADEARFSRSSLALVLTYLID